MVEKTFGTELREHAIRISRERFEARQEVMREGFRGADELAKER